MNCAMVSRSVGSVFSRRRISCLARDEGRVTLQSSPEPVPPPLPGDRRLCVCPKFLAHRNSELPFLVMSLWVFGVLC